jgi:uroporphyrinogen-III synthase
VTTDLRGARVVLTRAQDDLEALAVSVRAHGGEPLSLPCLTFTDPTDPAPVLALLDRLVRGDKPDALALASPQAVRRLVGVLRSRGHAPADALAGVRLCASGEATARLIHSVGLPRALAPAHEKGAGAQALAQALADEWARAGVNPAAQRVWLLKAEEGNPELPKLLAASGATLEQAALYKTVPSAPEDLPLLPTSAAAALTALRKQTASAIVFGSGSAARGFAQMLGDEGLAFAARTLVAAMGEKCRADCLALGITPGLVGTGGFEELLAALAKRLAEAAQ